MSLRLKISIWMTAGLLLILILSFSIVYYLFLRITTNGELELLKEKALALQERDLPNHPEYWYEPGHLDEFLIPQEMIRYIMPDSTVRYQIFSDSKLLSHRAVYTTRETVMIRQFHQGIYIFVKMPIYDQGKQVAVLEIGRSLKKLGEYSYILISILVLTSIGAVILALAIGLFYTKIIFRPLRVLITTMQNIERSGDFRRIELPQERKGDELISLGATFNKMINRLEDTFQKQKQFLADASHELRTPITIIESYASLLRRWALNDEKLREEALDAIQSEASQLKELTQNLLFLLDTEREQRINWESFDLLSLVQSTAAALRLTHGRNIEVRIPQKKLHMSGDPHKMKQLLVILLDNALKYSQKAVMIRVEQLKTSIQIQVIDQGIGIAEEDIPHLFDRFYRADKARNRKLGGVGLGLAIAHSIVKLHEGSIDINSLLGKGTTITVTFPI